MAPTAARAVCLVILLVALESAGCTRQDERLRQHQEKIQSLGASTTAIAEAWLAGSTTGTYTGTAIEEVFRLVEQERSALASTPDALMDPRGAELSQAGERLSRLLAAILRDVRAGDAQAVREQLARVRLARVDDR